MRLRCERGWITPTPAMSGSAPAVQSPPYEAVLSNMTHGAGMSVQSTLCDLNVGMRS